MRHKLRALQELSTHKMPQGGSISSSLNQPSQGTTPAKTAPVEDGHKKSSADGRPLPSEMAASALVESAHQNGSAAQDKGSQQSKGPPDPMGNTPQAEEKMPLGTERAVEADGQASQKRVEAPAISKASAAPAVSLTASGQTQNGKQDTQSPTAAAPGPAVAAGQASQPQHANAEASSRPDTHSQPAANPAMPSLTREAAIERLEGLLRRLSSEHDPEGFFREAVSKELEGCKDYYDRISQPMWLSRISSQVISIV